MLRLTLLTTLTLGTPRRSRDRPRAAGLDRRRCEVARLAGGALPSRTNGSGLSYRGRNTLSAEQKSGSRISARPGKRCTSGATCTGRRALSRTCCGGKRLERGRLHVFGSHRDHAVSVLRLRHPDDRPRLSVPYERVSGVGHTFRHHVLPSAGREADRDGFRGHRP